MTRQRIPPLDRDPQKNSGAGIKSGHMFVIECLNSKSFRRLLYVFLALGFTSVLLVNAWVCDDAYITFRTIDNFTHGYGLRWNIDERVQVYTHPLWMFTISLFYVFTSDVFYTSIFVSLFFSIAAVCIAATSLTSAFRRDQWKIPVFILSLLSSKAFIDYTSSGLETPLSYLIAILFFGRLISMDSSCKLAKRTNLLWLFFLASLAFVNRQDTILLYLPALIFILYIQWSRAKRRQLWWLLVATLPASMWLLFSLLYYGFPFSNTAYAKFLATGYPFHLKIFRGLEYLLNSLSWDFPCYAMLVATTVICWREKTGLKCLPVIGAVLYILYVVLLSSSATHMSGRFFALLFMLVIFVLTDRLKRPKTGLAISTLLVIYLILNPLSPFKFGTSAYKPYFPTRSSYIDTKWFVYKEGSALINWKPGRKLPDHQWYHYGRILQEKDEKVHLGGAFGGEPIGYAGFAAGPDIFIIDRIGLADPLLARLPAEKPTSIFGWKSGHFYRRIPPGYVESLERHENLLYDPNLRLYYEKLRSITRDPLFRGDRLRNIIFMNLGKYDYLIKEFPEALSRGLDRVHMKKSSPSAE